MKQTEIKEGVTYHDGKRGVRKVIGVGHEYVLYQGQGNTDCLRYLQVKGSNMGGQSNITRISFAQWAKGVVTDEAKTKEANTPI